MNMWRLDAYFPRDTRGLSMHQTIAFHFTTRVHAARPLDLVRREQFFTGMHDWVRAIWRNAALRLHCPVIIRAILQPFICRNSSHCPNRFRTLFVSYRVSGSPKNCFRQRVRALLWRPNRRWAVCHPSDSPFFFSRRNFWSLLLITHRHIFSSLP
jgi:hypothetical protein